MGMITTYDVSDSKR